MNTDPETAAPKADSSPSHGSDASIISLATGEPITMLKRKEGYCMSHCTNVLVDTHKRTLTCRECGGAVDSMDWASRMAFEESQLMHRIFSLKNEVSVHSNQLRELEGEEKRVKARIRGAKDSLLRSAGV